MDNQIVSPQNKTKIKQHQKKEKRRKRTTKSGNFFKVKATGNSIQQDSRHEVYLCNDCHTSLSKQILELVEIVDPEPESVQCKRTNNYHLKIAPFVRYSIMLSCCSFLLFSTSKSPSIFLPSSVLSRVVMVFSNSSVWSALSFFILFFVDIQHIAG